MALIPIGTDIRTQRPPVANYVLIALNVLVFLYTDYLGGAAGQQVKAFYSLDGARPQLHQYLTYQFLHGDILHLAGNMLFLWIFGNAVCDRMGWLGYTLFYIAGGVFSGVAFAATAQNPIIGASGAIAAVTTAFLALFPRVHVTLLVWMFFIFTFQVPAMILIVLKIILWDNIIAPNFDQGTMANVAYSAHLGGYAFGFAVAMLMLLIRALPRNQFDLVGLWSRIGRRHGWPVPGPTLPPVGARPITVEEVGSRPLEAPPLTPVEQLREEVGGHLAERDTPAAVAAYQRLVALDPRQVLAAPQQIEIANYLAQSRQYAAAAAAYEAFLDTYRASPDAPEVRLFLGLICSRYLQEFERAVRHLRAALEGLQLATQRTLAEDELRQAEARLSAG
jgi:membrane associated rhomboid family serine protease